MALLWTEVAGAWGDEVGSAAAFLTRIPVRKLKPHPPLSRAARAFPIIGAALGAGAGVLLSILVALGASPLLAAALTLAVLALTTGALHEDGLADSADGLGGGRDRQHALEIMRDSRIGTFGVLAIILVL